MRRTGGWPAKLRSRVSAVPPAGSVNGVSSEGWPKGWEPAGTRSLIYQTPIRMMS